MEQIPFRIYTLSNGMRLVAGKSDGFVTYCGVIVSAGSRDEEPGKEGLAHFVEHTIFKGTSTRKSWQISSRMEDIGGELNAYTTKECTSVYTKAPAGYDARAIELLADILTRSVFPPEELEKEKTVVIEEIKSYLDNPVESLFDEFDKLMLAGSPLAHPILGSEESVRSLTSEDCLDFVRKYYTPGNMVAYCLSPVGPEKILHLFEKYFGSLHGVSPERRLGPWPHAEKFDIVKDIDTHQANTILGMYSCGYRDPDRYRYTLLAHYLGGAFNSRLNRELRDKRGLVYSVYSSNDTFADAGVFTVTYGSDPESDAQCRRIIRKELDKLRTEPLGARTVETVKRQYVGRIMMSVDKRPNRILGIARSLVTAGRPIDVDERIRLMMEVTPEQLFETASGLDYDKFSILTFK